MTDQRFRIGILSNPSQIIACLTAIGYIAFCIYFMPPNRYGLSTFSVFLSTHVLVAVAIMAAICLIAPVKLMFLAGAPVIFILLSDIFASTNSDTPAATVIIIVRLICIFTVLTVVAYRFKEKSSGFTLLLLMFSIILAILAFDYYRPGNLPVNIDILSDLLLYFSLATVVRAIASGKNYGIPNKPVTKNHNYTPEQLAKITKSDVLPIIDYDVLQKMSEDIKSDYRASDINYYDIRRGLYVMDSLANKGNEVTNDGYRHNVIERWMNNQYQSFAKSSNVYKVLNPVLWVVSVVLLLLALTPRIMIMSPLFPQALAFLNVDALGDMREIIFILGVMLFPPVSMGIYYNFLKKPGNPVELECLTTSENVLAKFASIGTYHSTLALEEIKTFNTYLDKICTTLGVEAASFKEEFGKQSGGGSIYHGWGSGSAFGTGLLLSAISQSNAASKNKQVNDRIEAFETLFYYNNLCAHFYKHVLNNCDASTLLGFVLK